MAEENNEKPIRKRLFTEEQTADLLAGHKPKLAEKQVSSTIDEPIPILNQINSPEKKEKVIPTFKDSEKEYQSRIRLDTETYLLIMCLAQKRKISKLELIREWAKKEAEKENIFIPVQM